jgi:CheY-like chemotaxis protein
MNGNMAVASEVDKGTTFHFCITFGLDEAESGQDTSAFKPVTDTKCKVLLAEDDEVSIVVARKLLEKEGCKVTVARDGEQALNDLKREDFDIVLMDIQMPNLNGLQAVDAIRGGEAGADKAVVPIVALTSYAMSGDEQRFIQAGMNAYLSKPLDVEALRRVLSDVLGGACVT